jgi:hypothetical protein
MAINNWRYVVTWGYMNPDGTIVEETQWVPNKTNVGWQTTSNTNLTSNRSGLGWLWDSLYFPRAEAYWLQSKWYANQGDTAMANAYWDIAKNMWAYSNFANQSLWAADSLINYIRQNESWLQNVAWTLYNQLVGDMSNTRDYINRMFWPDGELTKEVNTYYDDLGNYLATDAGRQAANIAAQWVHSGASLGSIRAQQNEAYNESFQRYIQAKEQQINAKQQIAANLINYMSTLRKEYWDTTNQYVIDLYKRAADLYENVASSAANDLRDWNALRAKWLWWGSSKSTTETDPYKTYLDGLVSLRNQIANQWGDTTDLDKRIEQESTNYYKYLLDWKVNFQTQV